MAARWTQRSTSTIYGKIGDCEQFMIVSKISFGSLSVELVESFMDTILMVSFPKKGMGICIRHSSCSSIPRLLAVCLILLSGYQIPGKYQLRKNEIYFQPNNITKKCESLLQSATAILLHWRRQPAFRKNDSYLFFTKCDKCYHIVRQVLKSSVIIAKSNRTGVLMDKNFPWM